VDGLWKVQRNSTDSFRAAIFALSRERFHKILGWAIREGTVG
jgi:hypothetical protein